MDGSSQVQQRRGRRRVSRLAAVLALVAVVASGCYGPKEPTTTTADFSCRQFTGAVQLPAAVVPLTFDVTAPTWSTPHQPMPIEDLRVTGIDPWSISGVQGTAVLDATTSGFGVVETATPTAAGTAHWTAGPMDPPEETTAVPLGTATTKVTGPVGSTATMAVTRMEFVSFSQSSVGVRCVPVGDAPVIVAVRSGKP